MVIKGLENQINKISNDVMRKVCSKIQDELEERTLFAIAEFYQSYTPKYYHRHYYNFMDRSFQRYYHHSNGSKKYYAGVLFTPGSMANIYQYHNEENTEEVFNTVIMEGFHGPAAMIGMGYNGVGQEPHAFSRIPGRMYPTPFMVISDYRDKLSKKEKIQEIIDSVQKK